MSLPLPTDTELLKRLTDVHCHPTDTDEPARSKQMALCPINVCAMSTNPHDQGNVRQLALDFPTKVTPCFGYHPWFSHWITLEKVSKEQHYRKVLIRAASDPEEGDEEFQTLLASLPEPLLMDDLIDALRDDLASFPNALLGEVGLDRSMKVPLRSGPNGRHLSRFKVSIAHQLQVLEKQVALAVELRRSISLHSVNCQAITIEFIDRMKDYHKQGWQDINLDLHSCGFSAETWTTIEKRHLNVYMSFSTVINEKSTGFRSLIAICPSDRILAESDTHEVSRCASRTWSMVISIAEIKEWRIEGSLKDIENFDGESAGVIQRLARNWESFKRGRYLAKEGRKASELELATDEEEW